MSRELNEWASPQGTTGNVGNLNQYWTNKGKQIPDVLSQLAFMSEYLEMLTAAFAPTPITLGL